MGPGCKSAEIVNWWRTSRRFRYSSATLATEVGLNLEARGNFRPTVMYAADTKHKLAATAANFQQQPKLSAKGLRRSYL